MGPLDRSFIVAIYGARPNFDPAAGEMMALVSVGAGADEVLVDRERNRCRLAATPGPRDLDRWTGPTGLILAARRGAWGASIVEDHYIGDAPGPTAPLARPRPPRMWGRAPRELVPVRGRFRRASLPGDLCSCLRCRDLVVVRRSRRDGSPAGLSAPGRLFGRALRLLPGLPPCQGPGAASVTHGRDCPAWRLEDSGPIRADRRRRAGLLAQLLRALRREPVGAAWLEQAGKAVAR